MKHFPLILTLLLACTGCINTESPAVDEEQEASWWCSFYNTCADDTGGGSIYSTMDDKKPTGSIYSTMDTPKNAGGTTADSIGVSHGVSHDSGQ